ncbi:PepSY domain-containing protein [Alteromonas ponticola]|uniref:PepSY domain-containing protein n=1 Tax=Alteromonas ponticola TaxID=2720613 RepID=A0ABX1R424_9ALTE|nr:PepSY domain-containing protein [Alteromonas ponticola]NMH59965.1 PepSY domain-containing protein [Alteromonas ponticola]
MHPRIRQFSRKLHLWFALAIVIPSLIVIGSGIVLQIKKQSDWIQPPTQKGAADIPTLSFAEVLAISSQIPQLEVTSWEQIERVDVQPAKGMMKVLATNNWEAQIDAKTGDILQVAYRRSDIIESIHDGSWFADSAKLWIFLPAGIALFIMWCSGLVLLVTTLKSKFKKKSLRSK